MVKACCILAAARQYVDAGDYDGHASHQFTATK